MIKIVNAKKAKQYIEHYLNCGGNLLLSCLFYLEITLIFQNVRKHCIAQIAK